MSLTTFWVRRQLTKILSKPRWTVLDYISLSVELQLILSGTLHERSSCGLFKNKLCLKNVYPGSKRFNPQMVCSHWAKTRWHCKSNDKSDIDHTRLQSDSSTLESKPWSRQKWKYTCNNHVCYILNVHYASRFKSLVDLIDNETLTCRQLMSTA